MLGRHADEITPGNVWSIAELGAILVRVAWTWIAHLALYEAKLVERTVIDSELSEVQILYGKVGAKHCRFINVCFDWKKSLEWNRIDLYVS